MSQVNHHLLSLLIALPTAGALLVALTPRGAASLQKVLGLALTGAAFVLSLLLLPGFRDVGTLQFVERAPWIPAWGITYYVGIDGLSLWLVILSTFLTPLALLGSWSSIRERVREFVVFMLLLEAGMVGVFVALDLFLFYVFWEAMLIPMYFLIGIWGHERRIYAAVKFFLYTFAGSVLMLVAFLVLYKAAGIGSFGIPELVATPVAPALQVWLFLACALAFAIKVPMWPFHTWLPDAHVEAPTAGSVILAGVLLKMGAYGFLRLAIPLFPNAAMQFAPLVGVLAVWLGNSLLGATPALLKKGIPDEAFAGNLGWAYYLKGDFGNAEKYLKIEKELKKLDSTPRNNLGLVYFSQGRYEDALASFKEASELNKNSVLLPYFLAVTYNRLGKEDEVVKALQEGLKRDPDLEKNAPSYNASYFPTAEPGDLSAVFKKLKEEKN